MSRTLFGTDGVRGVAGEFLSAALAQKLGRAATAHAAANVRGARVLIIRDTRESGPMLEAAVASGVAAAGGEALIGGVLPTPAAPLLLQRYGFDLAAVISASHNPYEDNGIKFFGRDGFKLTDAQELEIEQSLDEPGMGTGTVRIFHNGLEDYLGMLHERFQGLDLSGRRIVLDCANGATYQVGPQIFRRLGADVRTLADEPDGRNINRNCGSTHIDGLRSAVTGEDADVGFAFDGDGDRLLAVDRTGEVVDGDELIALAAHHLRASGRLPNNGVAVTVMTNYGFHSAMQDAGIDVVTTNVGDRYVLAALREQGLALGGEQSGHIIELGFGPSGDGIAGALLTLEALGRDGDLADRAGMTKLPQVLRNVRITDRSAYTAAEDVHAAVAQEHEQLAGRGRVLVRASGTEPLIRVMVEAPTAEEADAVCGRLVDLVQARLGG